MEQQMEEKKMGMQRGNTIIGEKCGNSQYSEGEWAWLCGEEKPFRLYLKKF